MVNNVETNYYSYCSDCNSFTEHSHDTQYGVRWSVCCECVEGRNVSQYVELFHTIVNRVGQKV